MKPTEAGLTTIEAERLLKTFGLNELEEPERLLPLKLFLNQFKSPLVFILVIAGAVAMAAGLVKDSYLILSILFINAGLGFWQEFKAEKSLQALKKITVSQTRVIRDGQEKIIGSSLIVPGDLVILGVGRVIPADCKLLENYSVEVNESALTGESLPLLKTGGDDEASLVFMGTIVTAGSARAEVLHTGMRARFGKIAQELKEVKEEPTPFQISIERLSRKLGVMALFAAIAVFVLGVYKGQPGYEVFLVSASLAVAAVPSALPAVVSLTLALGVQRMARRHAIVRKMAAVEALGSITIICTDKTGTITTGDMSVRHLWFDGRDSSLRSWHGVELPHSLRKIIEVCVLVNTAGLIVSESRERKFDIVGDPTDGALLMAAEELGQRDQIKGRVLEEFAFDRTRKIVSAVVEVGGRHQAMVRGAPERILSLCSVWRSGTGVVNISKEVRGELEAAFHKYAEKGFRVIGFAEKSIAGDKVFKREEVETDLVYLGFIAISDPPRLQVLDSLSRAKKAGVNTMMLTGDNILTAKAIGEEVGMLDEGDEVIEGTQIDELTDGELDRYIKRVKIVARATPEHKLRIIQSLQRLKETVAVTGDGVNDALALKQADVGVAMGGKGTDVAKQASDIILTDDQYATIVAAVDEGRRIDNNLKQVVRYLVAGNFSEVLTVFIAVAFGSVTPLLPVQLLWINIVTDALPAFALAASRPSKNLLREPKMRGEQPLNKYGLKFVLSAGVVVAGFTLALYYAFLPFGLAGARTMAFTVMVAAQMVLAIVIARAHSEKNQFWHMNRYLVLSVLGTLAIQTLFLFLPQLRETFHLELPKL